ncbi:MAG: hypothetical protein WBC91_01340 [Phototrophicaceae bacterium]
MNKSSKQLDPQSLSADLRQDIFLAVEWIKSNGYPLKRMVYQTRKLERITNSVEVDGNRIDQVIENLQYEFQKFDLDSFIAHIEAYKKEKIRLVPFNFTKSTSGLYVKASDLSFIFYNENRNPVLRNHIIIHELAHLLLDHSFLETSIEGYLEAQLGVQFRSYLPSNYNDSSEEQEAEEFSRRILVLVAKHARNKYLSDEPNATLYPPFNR